MIQFIKTVLLSPCPNETNSAARVNVWITWVERLDNQPRLDPYDNCIDCFEPFLLFAVIKKLMLYICDSSFSCWWGKLPFFITELTSLS